MNLCDYLTTFFLGSGVGVAGAAYCGRRFVDVLAERNLAAFRSQLQHTSLLELERFRTETAREAYEHQVRFSKLHERRAEVIAEIYRLLHQFVDAAGGYVNLLQVEGGPDNDARRARFNDAMRQFYEYTFPRLLYLPPEISKKAKDLFQEIRGAGIDFYYLVDRAPQGNSRAWLDAHHKIKHAGDVLLEDLANDFRAILEGRPGAASVPAAPAASKHGPSTREKDGSMTTASTIDEK